MCYEFARNGRRYYLYPSGKEPTPKIKVAEAEEFINFIDDEAEVYLLRPDEIEPAGNCELKPKGKLKKYVPVFDEGMVNRDLVVEGARKPLPGGDGSQLAPGHMDSRYADPRTTDLKETVKPGVNRITLTVKRAAKPK